MTAEINSLFIPDSGFEMSIAYLNAEYAKHVQGLTLSNLRFISRTEYKPNEPKIQSDLTTVLSGINKNNAYEVFQKYRKEHGEVFNLITETLIKYETSSDYKITIRDMIMPIASLLKQAEKYNLENAPAYKNLKQRHREMCALFVNVKCIPELSEIVTADYDNAINDLLNIMSKVFI